MRKYFGLILGFIGIFAVNWVYAAQTKYINLQGASAFVKGEFKNIQMTAKGSLLLSPEVKEIYDTKNLLIQSSFATDKGVYFSTAKDAGLFYYDIATKETKKLYENSQSLSIPSFAFKDNILYFVESPSNILYALDLAKEDAQPEELQKLDIGNYIWQIAIQDETLYFSTGAKAGLFKLSLSDLKSRPESLFTVEEERHFITMVIKSGKAYLGGEGAGGVYEVDLETGKSKTLYNAYEGEISDIVVSEREGIFIATSNKEPKTVGGEFDYTDTLLSQQLEYQILKSKLMDAKQINEDGSLKEEQQGAAVKNSLYQIQGTKINKLVTLDNMSLNKIFLTEDQRLMIGTSGGRIFQYSLKDKTLGLLASLENEDITGIISIGDYFFTATSNIGQVYLLGQHLSTEGSFTSEVIDLGNTATLGQLTLDEEFLNRGDIQVFLRGGQTQSPDNNWLDWQGPFHMDDDKTRLSLKDLRYVQFKIEMMGKENKSPELIRILAPYMPDNRVPTITLFTAFYDASQQDGAPKQNLQIRWSALDGDKDQLFYRVYFKQRSDVAWSLLSEAASQDKMVLDTKLLPDGVYQFKLEVSDELDNSPEKAGKAIQISNYVLINNTPPTITVTDVNPVKEVVEIQGTIENPVALIAKAYFKVGVEQQWKFIIPKTGLYDDKKISFRISVPKKDLKNFENIVFFRAFDVNMNQISYRIKLNKLGKQIV